jgi:hypothetical protein
MHAQAPAPRCEGRCGRRTPAWCMGRPGRSPFLRHGRVFCNPTPSCKHIQWRRDVSCKSRGSLRWATQEEVGDVTERSPAPARIGCEARFILGLSRTIAGAIMAPWFDTRLSKRRAVCHEEINRLPRVYRTALVLCAIERRPIDLASKELKCSVRCLRRRVATGVELLRLRMTRRFCGIPPATWDANFLHDLEDTVPERLIQSTVAAAVSRPVHRLDLGRARGPAKLRALVTPGSPGIVGRGVTPRSGVAHDPAGEQID